MNLDIKTLLEESLEDFTQSSMSPFEDLPKISLMEKKKNEKEARKLIDKLQAKAFPLLKDSTQGLNNESKENLRAAFMDFAFDADKKEVFFDGPFFNYFLSHGYLESAEDFFCYVKTDNPQMLLIDFFQALRNTFIASSLQLLFGKKVEFTTAIGAYSLLYPYTDNFIDDATISSQEKKIFNKRFQERLEGKEILPMTLNEEKIFGAIADIEEVLPRQNHALVYESLLLIYDAQVSSMGQEGPARLSPHIILPISFYKGGASVLADACLVNENITKDMIQFSFNYGTFLQLIDDLQDFKEDRKNHHWTLFSLKNKEEIHDLEISKLISYMATSIGMVQFKTKEEETLKNIIFDACLMMVMSVVGKHPYLISSKFYKALESISRFKLSFYAELEDKMSYLAQEDWTKTTLEKLDLF